jgi:glycosyltransferase involved in cell wall biosynthesis
VSLVTVIIPTYNRASLLPRAIGSVLAQTHRPVELLVVDDGSSDATEGVVRGFGDPAIRYIRHERNQGQCAAINTGIRAATGEFVSFLDSDDEWLPEMIRKQLEVFAKHGERMGVVYTHGGAHVPDGSPAVSHVSHLQGRIYPEALAQGHVAHSIAILVRRRCFDKIGVFDTRFSCFQDDDICFRLAKEYEFGLVPEVLAIVHASADDRLTADRRPYARGWHDLLRKHEAEILRECGPGVLARHLFREGLLFLDAGDRKAAFAAFSKAFRLDPSIKPLGGMFVSVAPFQATWVNLFRALRARHLRTGTMEVTVR